MPEHFKINQLGHQLHFHGHDQITGASQRLVGPCPAQPGCFLSGLVGITILKMRRDAGEGTTVLSGFCNLDSGLVLVGGFRDQRFHGTGQLLDKAGRGSLIEVAGQSFIFEHQFNKCLRIHDLSQPPMKALAEP